MKSRLRIAPARAAARCPSVPLACALAVALGLAGLLPAQATTYVAMADGELLRQAQVVAEVTVLQELAGVRGPRPSTDYLAAVDRVIKGALDASSLVVRTPGGFLDEGDAGKAGEPDGELFVEGAPRFREGDRVLLFLAANRDGTYSPLHLALGAFFRRGSDPDALAVRALDEALLLDLKLEPAVDVVRRYDGFVHWLGENARGNPTAPDYFLERPAASAFLSRPYTLMEYEGRNVRWFDFDGGGAVGWRFRAEDSAGTRPEFEAALGAWRRGAVNLVLSGETGSTDGYARTDGLNSIIFGDPNDSVTGTYSCGRGGTLATGGWRARGTGRFQGKTYARIFEAEIVVNDGTECLLEADKTAAAELFTHELGHTLGIGHSCGDGKSGVCGRETGKDEATMRATLHNDGRGASVRPDDNAALAALYGAPAPSPLQGPEPSNLTARALNSIEGRLVWQDNSLTESSFELWRAVGSGAFKLWRSVAADTTALEFADGKPGRSYRFKVRAVLGDPASQRFTEFSDSASVTLPDGLKRPKKLKAEATSSTSGRLTWKDRSKGEREFWIERRIGSGDWKFWRTVPEDTTSLEFDDGLRGESYGFRIQARDGATRSRYSKTARVTMP